MRWIPWIAIGTSLLASFVQAQSSLPRRNDPIGVVMEPIQFPPRTGTFYPVTCTITNLTSGLWEGSIRVSQIEDLPSDFEVVIPDLVVGTTPLEFTMSLPPIVPNLRNQQTELRAFAIDKSGKTSELPNIQLISHTRMVRTLTFGVCTVDGVRGVPEDVAPLIRELQLFDNGSFQTQDNRTLRCAIPNPIARDLPENSLDYIRFDGLFLSKRSLEQIRPKQYQAILDWVGAGGTLAINLPETLEGEQLDFLNRLISETRTKLLRDPEKGILSDPPMSEPLIAEFGLGQAALLPGNYLEEHAEDQEGLSRLSRQLWRTLPEFQKILETRNPQFERMQLQQEQFFQKQLQANRGMAPVPSTTVPFSTTSIFVNVQKVIWDLLRPRNMGVIPIHFLILSLAVYVILIGPGDYYILGRLKTRRFTWVVFPLVTLGFSWGILKITNMVMGNNDKIRSIRIIDLDRFGNQLRENRISLLMFSYPKRETLDVSNGYAVRMNSDFTSYNAPGWDSRRWSRGRPTYVGRLPSRYSVNIDADQWSPDRYRITRFGGPPPLPDFPWEKYADGRLILQDQTGSGLRSEFLEDMKKVMGPSAYAILHNGDSTNTLAKYDQVPVESFANHNSYASLLQMTPASESYWMRRVSPQGSESNDDLSILELGDQTHFAIGIVAPEADDLVFYRILMKKSELHPGIPGPTTATPSSPGVPSGVAPNGTSDAPESTNPIPQE